MVQLLRLGTSNTALTNYFTWYPKKWIRKIIISELGYFGEISKF